MVDHLCRALNLFPKINAALYIKHRLGQCSNFFFVGLFLPSRPLLDPATPRSQLHCLIASLYLCPGVPFHVVTTLSLTVQSARFALCATAFFLERSVCSLQDISNADLLATGIPFCVSNLHVGEWHFIVGRQLFRHLDFGDDDTTPEAGQIHVLTKPMGSVVLQRDYFHVTEFGVVVFSI